MRNAIGIDSSHYQGNINWNIIVHAGISFAFLKATQGTSQDPTFKMHWNYLNQNPFIIKGAYHFYDTSIDPGQQAYNFCNTVGELGLYDLPPVVDIEEDKTNGSMPLTERIATLSNYLHLIMSKLNRTPILYTNAYFFNTFFGGTPQFKQYDLWISEYANNNKMLPADNISIVSPKLPAGFSNYKFYQYTANGFIDGGDNTGNQFDFNIFNGDLDSLKLYIRDSALNQEA